MSKEMRKVRTGTVVRTKSDKTTIVEMVWKQRHRLYRKQMRRVARFYVHDPLSQCQLGDIVRIQETRPISKTKRWRLLEILERHLVADVRPIELESDADVILAPEEETETEEIVDEAAAEEESEDDDTEDEDESQEESEEDEPEAADELEEEPTAEEEEEEEQE
ncbi:MAG TPA: 30S ribosomal protein S17 [Dehalococcoidia bacterium]|nr:30S ribosomal protein S17 [Dehalococcoidia bacterium]